MACEAGRCGSCVFTSEPGDAYATLSSCKIKADPTVEATYNETSIKTGEYVSLFSFEKVVLHWGICSKYQLNPNAVEY